MTLFDSLASALDSLRASPLRSALTALGIIIGVAAVIAMVAIGSGAEYRVKSVIESLGSNIIVVVNGARNASGRRIGQGSRFTLTEQDAAALNTELDSVQSAAAAVGGGVQIVWGNTNWYTQLRGVTRNYFDTRDWVFTEGRNMTANEERSAAKVVMLGKSVVDQMFGGNSPIGQIVRIQRVPFQVIGVLGEKGQTPWGGDQDDVVFMPLSTAKKRVLGGRRVRGNLVGNITVKAVSAGLLKTAERDLTDLLRQRHKLGPNDPNDFFIRNVAEAMAARAESSKVMSTLLASVAAVSLLVGGIGIMNIMLVSVTERTREIGLRIAVGARRGDIMLQFVIEALSLSLIGGLFGIALGIGGSIVISNLAGWPVLIGPESVVIAALFSAAVGIFFGYYPARQAARLDPIEALRQE